VHGGVGRELGRAECRVQEDRVTASAEEKKKRSPQNRTESLLLAAGVFVYPTYSAWQPQDIALTGLSDCV